MGYRHIVLFRLHDDVTDAQSAAAVSSLRSLASLPGVLQWRVEQSADRRKGRVIVENGLFTGRSSYLAFKDDPRHAAAGSFLTDLADWWIGDYEE